MILTLNPNPVVHSPTSPSHFSIPHTEPFLPEGADFSEINLGHFAFDDWGEGVVDQATSALWP